MSKIDTIFLITFEAGHTYKADIHVREYLSLAEQRQREVSQVNTFQSAWALATDRISTRKATHLHKSPQIPGLLMRKISTSQSFSDFEYLFGNETPFPSEKELLVGSAFFKFSWRRSQFSLCLCLFCLCLFQF